MYVASLPGTASNHERRCSAVMLNTSVQLVTFGTEPEGVPVREAWPLTPGLGVLVADAVGVAVVVGFPATAAPGGRIPGGLTAALEGAAVVGGRASGGAVG